MDRKMFRENLIAVIKELIQNGGYGIDDYKFVIVPVKEEKGHYTSEDDFMRLTILHESNLKGRVLTMEYVAQMLSAMEPKYPLWVEVSYMDKANKIVEVRTSMRFRKIIDLSHKDTGHPPFVVR